ncbi:alpha-galactosidase [Microbacterium sp. NPDC057650]|uniref:alpha-galactosidase n=1 Tax=unclassified Microbacterium TaxID=2609290 RepID=UPI0036716D2F
MSEAVDAGLVMRSAGRSIALDIRAGALPAVLHWGPDTGDLDAAEFEALAASGILPAAGSEPDVPVAVSVLPEHGRGWQGAPGISGSRAGRDWAPLFTVTGALLDGAEIAAGARAVLQHGSGLLRVEAVDAEHGLALTLEIEMTAAGVVRMRAALRNTAADPYQLDGLLLCLPTPLEAAEALDFAGRWGAERIPQRGTIRIGQHRRENRRGRTGLGAATMLLAGVPGFGYASGRVWGLHTGWSGDHVHQIERMPEGRQLLGGGELLLPGEIVLAEGEEYLSPWVYGFHGDGLDDIADSAHRMLRARPQHPSTPRPVTLNVWEAVYFDQNEEDLVELAEAAAEVGVERFVLDDGWFGARRSDRAGLGDWTVSADVWPQGLHPLVDRVRALGMQFGLWVEPEMINVDSDLARAHPDWIMRAGAALPIPARNQQVLDLANPDCYRHIRDSLLALLDEYDISYLKWDHNRDLVAAGHGPARTPGVHGQTLAFYRLVDELKQAHPGLEIESCSSGGARVDLGVIERTDRVWASDDNDPLERERINGWTMQLLPPELIGAHIASAESHTTGRTHPMAFRAAEALIGHLGVELDLRHCTVDELEAVRAWIALHKEHREMLHNGRLVRLDVPDQAHGMHGIVAADGSSALYVYTARTVGATSTAGRMRLTGLDADRRYRVVVEPLSVEGARMNPAAWQEAGIESRGRMLGTAGVVMPSLQPEQAIVLHATAVD